MLIDDASGSSMFVLLGACTDVDGAKGPCSSTGDGVRLSTSAAALATLLLRLWRPPALDRLRPDFAGDCDPRVAFACAMAAFTSSIGTGGNDAAGCGGEVPA